MNIKELKTKPETELHQMLKQEREHLRQLRFDLASKKLKKVRDVLESKKTIARILTLLNQKRINQDKITNLHEFTTNIKNHSRLIK